MSTIKVNATRTIPHQSTGSRVGPDSTPAPPERNLIPPLHVLEEMMRRFCAIPKQLPSASVAMGTSSLVEAHLHHYPSWSSSSPPPESPSHAFQSPAAPVSRQQTVTHYAQTRLQSALTAVVSSTAASEHCTVSRADTLSSRMLGLQVGARLPALLRRRLLAPYLGRGPSRCCTCRPESCPDSSLLV
jgi:hypothetical protein